MKIVERWQKFPLKLAEKLFKKLKFSNLKKTMNNSTFDKQYEILKGFSNFIVFFTNIWAKIPKDLEIFI